MRGVAGFLAAGRFAAGFLAAVEAELAAGVRGVSLSVVAFDAAVRAAGLRGAAGLRAAVVRGVAPAAVVRGARGARGFAAGLAGAAESEADGSLGDAASGPSFDPTEAAADEAFGRAGVLRGARGARGARGVGGETGPEGSTLAAVPSESDGDVS